MKELHLKSVYDPVSINWITMPGNQVLFLMVTSAPLSNVTQLRFRSVALSLGRSVARSLGRSVARSLGHKSAHSHALSFGHSVIRPSAQLITRSPRQLVIRPLGYSVVWSLGCLATQSLGHKSAHSHALSFIKLYRLLLTHFLFPSISHLPTTRSPRLLLIVPFNYSLSFFLTLFLYFRM